MSIILQESFDVITCYKCGIAFAVPSHWNTKRREDKEYFWCPNGHEQSYCQSISDRLRNELEQTKRSLLQSQNREAEAYAALNSEQKKTKRLSKRLANGVCPVPGCKRHFTNLQRHINTEHGGIAIPAPAPVKLLEKAS